MSMEEKQNQNAGQPENKAKIEPVIRKDQPAEIYRKYFKDIRGYRDREWS